MPVVRADIEITDRVMELTLAYKTKRVGDVSGLSADRRLASPRLILLIATTGSWV